MNTALMEVNSTDLMIERAKQLYTVIEKGATKFSDREAESYSRVLDGMILAANRLISNLKDANYFRLTVIIEQASTEDIILEETTYQNTHSMNMMYDPPYIPNDEIASNYTIKLTSPHHSKCVHSAVWVFTPSDSSSTAFLVRNYATPGAKMQFNYNCSKNWWDITFDKFRGKDIFITDGDSGRSALSTKIDGDTVYLVNISATKTAATDDRKVIVGATEDMIRTSVYMWKMMNVGGQVKHKFPIVPYGI